MYSTHPVGITSSLEKRGEERAVLLPGEGKQGERGLAEDVVGELKISPRIPIYEAS